MYILKRLFIQALILCTLSFLVVSCELFGLEFQTDYENKAAPVKTELGVSCFEFIESRSGLDFSLLYEAIIRADMKDFFEADSLTYFLLNDDEFSTWLVAYRYASVKSTPISALQNLIKSYTVKGLYDSYNLTSSPIEVPTEDGVRILRMNIAFRESTSSQNITPLQAGYVRSDGTVQFRRMKTANLRGTNGIMHVLSQRF